MSEEDGSSAVSEDASEVGLGSQASIENWCPREREREKNTEYSDSAK